ncbi:MAG: ABC-2 family transporter protein, partial [Chloroflexota bacterium]
MIVRYVTLLRTFFAINAASELQYRANFVLALLRSLINVLTNGANLALIFSNTTTLAGWSAPELVAVTGVWFVMAGLLRLVIRPSLAKLMEDVRLGTLDYMLV